MLNVKIELKFLTVYDDLWRSRVVFRESALFQLCAHIARWFTHVLVSGESSRSQLLRGLRHCFSTAGPRPATGPASYRKENLPGRVPTKVENHWSKA
jgi:hypothetical protein